MEKQAVNIQNGKNIVWIELLRVVSAFAVIMIHISGSVVKRQELLFTDAWIEIEFFHAVTRFAVGCFVMISGALFLNPQKEITISKIIKKYVSKIVVLYAVWSTLYTLYYIIVTVLNQQEVSKMTTVWVWTTGYYHLWFLFLIAGLYLITPLVRKMVEDKKHCEYLIFLCFIFYFIPNMLRVIPKLYDIYAVILEEKMQFHFVMGYIGYYVLGYYLNTYEVKAKIRKVIYVMGVLGCVYSVVGGILYSRYMGQSSVLAYDELTLPVVLYSMAIFLFFKYELADREIVKKHTKLIYRMGEFTLGIYVTHAIWVEIIAQKVLEQFQYRLGIIIIPLVAGAIFALSFGLVFILKKIPILNRWVV